MPENRAEWALKALRATDQDDMGRVHGGMGAEATDLLAELEQYMRAYRTWSPFLVPGVLQTSMYTAAAIRARTPSLPPEEVTTRVRHRRTRAEAFLAHMAGRTGRAYLLMGEAAITRPLLTRTAHADQLRHLLNIARDYTNVVIQVMAETSPMPGVIEPFDIYYLEDGPTVGHLETIVGGWYTLPSVDISRLHGTFNEMIGCAMTPQASRMFIQEMISLCWETTTGQTTSNPPIVTRTIASTSLDPWSEL